LADVLIEGSICKHTNSLCKQTRTQLSVAFTQNIQLRISADVGKSDRVRGILDYCTSDAKNRVEWQQLHSQGKDDGAYGESRLYTSNSFYFTRTNIVVFYFC
jgi:hypothetical protein